MIDIDNLLNKLNSVGNNITKIELEKQINKINRKDITKRISNQYKLEIWDKKSKINNIDAKTILEHRNYDIDSVYLIYINDKIVYFQDYNPNENGYKMMTEEEAKQIGNDYMNKKIENDVDKIIYDMFLNNKTSNK